MKKIALEAWEKNKDKIRSYIEKYYSHGDYNKVGRVLFLEEILNIAFGGGGVRTFTKLVEVGYYQVMLFAIFAEGRVNPTIITTRYSILNNYVIKASSISDLYDISKDIVLSAKPIDESYRDNEWAEDCTVEQKYNELKRKLRELGEEMK